MTGADPLVAVLLGTDHHPFTRLVSWVEDLAAATGTVWFVQHGTTPLPAGLTGAPILAVAQLQDLLDRAAAVVTHGGPGLIMEARAAGHHPIVVPRDPGHGEHVDDHQQRFCARLAREGLVTVVDDVVALGTAVTRASTHGRGPVTDSTAPTPAADRLGVLVDALVARRATRRAGI